MNRITQVLKSSRAAIDLASIMVGVIVIGLIGGVIAATVFSVIPWAQDSAAKQQLDSVVSAESANVGLNGHYSSVLTDLYNAADAKTFITSDEKTCYLAVQKSASGNYFYNTNNRTAPTKINAGAWPASAPASVPAGCSWPTEAMVKALPNATVQKLLKEAVVNETNVDGYMKKTVDLKPSTGYTLAAAWTTNAPQGNQTIMGAEQSYKFQQSGSTLLSLSGSGPAWTQIPTWANALDTTGKTNAVVSSITPTGGNLYSKNVNASIPQTTGNITGLNIGGNNSTVENVTPYGTIKQALAWDRTLTADESNAILSYLQQQ
jgi:type II secretory pathway pseudopilin PulG